MILMSGFFLGDVPFKTVYLHGLVRDARGRKMSKSLGNIVDPVDMIEKYGADAVRLSLVIGTAPGTDLRLSEDKIRGYKHFTNKLWNIARFVLEHTEDAHRDAPLNEADQKLADTLQALAIEVTQDLEELRLYLAGEKLYHYTWHTFADKILEESKSILAGENGEAKESRKRFLLETLETLLKLLHPFMPFVTEEIWSCRPAGKAGLPEARRELLIVTPWPT
jgi:valyl-tRNA synthetase